MSGPIRLSAALVFTMVCVAAVERATQANRNFIPDWTFTGSSLADADGLGAAEWTAQNGEVIGTPSSPRMAFRFQDHVMPFFSTSLAFALPRR
jgi:hypothetical protein